MTTLVRDGLELRYEVHGGSGRALLLPHLNFSWPDYLDLTPFAVRFTVISASPRGFATSSCPLLAFWGDQDEELGPGGTDQLASGLDRHGLQHVSFPGYDHDGMLNHINDAAPNVLAWLDQL